MLFTSKPAIAAVAGFVPVSFFLTPYMQGVPGWSPIQTGLAYLPLTGAVVVASGIVAPCFPESARRR